MDTTIFVFLIEGQTKSRGVTRHTKSKLAHPMSLCPLQLPNLVLVAVVWGLGGEKCCVWVVVGSMVDRATPGHPFTLR